MADPEPQEIPLGSVDFWQLAQLHQAQRQRRLARTGPYARVRHPQYAGFVLIMAGFPFHWHTLVTLLLFPILVVMCVRLARAEEADSRAAFGAAYADSTSGTPRWIPFPRPRHSWASQHQGDR